MVEQVIKSPVKLGRVLKDARKSKGLTQQALATQTGLPQPTISNLERGTIPLSVHTLLRLAAALDLELVIKARPNGEPDFGWE